VTVAVSVTDAVGEKASATLVLDVQNPSNGTAPHGGSTTDVPGTVASAGIVLAGAAVAAAVWWRRRGGSASA